MPKKYSIVEKQRILKFADSHSERETADKHGTSKSTITRWKREFRNNQKLLNEPTNEPKEDLIEPTNEPTVLTWWGFNEEQAMDLIREYKCPSDKTEVLLNMLAELSRNLKWEEIADFYWEYREVQKYEYENFAQILNWIAKQRDRKPLDHHLYAGSEKNESDSSLLETIERLQYHNGNLQKQKEILEKNLFREQQRFDFLQQEHEKLKKQKVAPVPVTQNIFTPLELELIEKMTEAQIGRSPNGAKKRRQLLRQILKKC